MFLKWLRQCLLVCSPHYYGSDCDIPCGQCRGNDVCHNVTGHCPNGCKQHWTGPRCDGKQNIVTIKQCLNQSEKY